MKIARVRIDDNEVYGLVQVGLLADRPAFGTVGRIYYASDSDILYYDTGAAWFEELRGESVSRLAQLAEKAHTSLSGVTSDLHHPQLHATEHGAIGDDPIEDALSLLAIPNLSAAKITSERFPVARLPAVTDEMLLVGTGNSIEERAMPAAPVLKVAKATITYDGGATQAIATLPAGSIVIAVMVNVRTAWDDDGACQGIGDATDQDGFMLYSHVLTSATGWKGTDSDTGDYLYESTDKTKLFKLYTAETTINATMLSNTYAQGEMDVYIIYIDLGAA